MNKEKLSQLCVLKKEIEETKRRIKKLENAILQCTSQPTNERLSGGYSDRSGNLATLIADQKDLLTWQIQQAWEAYDRLNRYIASVEDPQMRLILSLRYVDGLKWRQIASRIGGGNTADGMRIKTERYLLRNS